MQPGSRDPSGRADEWLDRRVVPAALQLPSNAEYLAHLDIATGSHGRLIRLAANENTELPSPRVRAALERTYADANLSPPTMPALRLELARRHGVDANRVLLSAGSTEVIDAIFRTFVRAGDEVVLPRPTWPVFRRRLQALEATIVEVPMLADETTWSFDVDGLLAAVTERTKLVVVCTPNNPTGNALHPSDLRRVADLGVPLLVDGAYADFDASVDFTAILHEHDNAIVTRTFSKAYCLAGLRVGYAIGTARMIDYVDRFLVPGSSVSSSALHAGLAALEDEPYHRAQVARIVGERKRLLDGLRAGGVRAFDSRGNFVAVDASKAPGGARGLAAAFFEQGIVVRPLMDELVRITVGRVWENDAVLAAARG